MSYTPQVNKFADLGLQLNLPQDLIPPSSYSRLTNAVPRTEGRLETRAGVAKIAQVGGGSDVVHSLFRLTQPNPTVTGERLLGVLTSLFTAPLPLGSAFTPLTGLVYDGRPLSIISFQFDGDPIPWAIIGNSAGMRKRRDGYYQILGLVAPTAQATSVGAGAGLLDSTNGTGYDWRFTYVNEVTLSESNPSPIQTAAQGSGGGSVPNETLRPTAFLNPDPDFGGSSPFIDPAFAIDGNPATFAHFGPSTFAIATCRWTTWGTPTFPYSSITLYVDAWIVQSGFATTPSLQYSTDGGVSWVNIAEVVGVRETLSVALPFAQDLTKLLVRRVDAAAGLVVGAIETRVYDIWTVGVPTGSGSGGLVLVNKKASVCVKPPVDPQETAIRLYRRGGSLVSAWYFTIQSPVSALVRGGCGPGFLEMIDNNPDSAIVANPTLQLDNDMPVTSIQQMALPLPIIFGPFDGRVLGMGDPNRAGAVYFSKRGNADEYPPQNFVFVSPPNEPMMNGVVYATRCFAFSTERMYVLVPNIIQGATFTPFETACRGGLRGRYALTTGSAGIYFVAKDGVFLTDGGPEQAIAEDSIRPLFPTQDAPGRDTNGYEAVDMTQVDALRLAYHNGEVWFGYIGLTSQLRKWLVYDERKKRWRASVHTPLMAMAYSEPSDVSSLLFGGTDGALYQASGTSDNGVAIPVNLRTGAFDQGFPLKVKEYGNVLFDLDPGGTSITITPFFNGEVSSIAPLVITGAGRQTIPLTLSDTLARNVSFDISWTGGTPVLFQLTIMYRPSATALRHWELPPTSHGLSGFMHVRDAYLSLRSNAPVTFTVTVVDGVVTTQTFVIPSTAGAKKKVYVPFGPNKGRLYGYSIDSTADFSLYQPEMELRVKPWNTKLGYAVVPILGGENPPPVVE